MKKTSALKIKTNRDNSLKSTGPQTKKGKNIVKWNALKHGLLSKEVVITVGDGKESESDFKRLLARFFEELEPVGILEEMLVEKIVVCYWRLRRAIRCEKGEIRKRLDTSTWESIFKRIDDCLQNRKFIILDGFREKLRRSSMGLRYLIAVLQEVRCEIECSGNLSEDTKQKILENFGSEQGSAAFKILLFDYMSTDGQKLSEEDPEKYGEPIEPEKAKKAMLKTIDDEIEQMEEFRESFNENEDMELDANCLSLNLPDKAALDKILRYETTIERQFYRALHELIRLQSTRKGGNPTVPLALDVNISNEV